MRTLTLIRHAKSSWQESALNDFDRPLNARGERDAPAAGTALRGEGVSFDLMVSSPALRALTTARLIAAAMGYAESDILQEADLYDANVRELLGVVHRLPDRATTVALVAHNPGLTDLGNFLSGEHIENLPTCALASISFELDTWQAVWRDSGRLTRYEYPRKYRV